MKKFITVILAIISMNTMADQVIFSQFDGDHTWTNLIINVNNAKTFIEPGVAFVSATDGYRNISTPGSFGVKGVKGVEAMDAVAWSPRKIKIVHGGFDAGTKTFDFVQTSPGTNDFQIVHTNQGRAPIVQSTVQTWSEAALNALGNGAAVHTDISEVAAAAATDAVEGVEEVKATKKRIAKTEQPQVAKAVVVVPKDASMYFFALYFFDVRITYLQLLDNYQNMHPLVPFTGNK